LGILGTRGRLLGADGQEVEPEDLVRELSSCRALRGKAKAFLLPGCQGGEAQRLRGWRSRFPWLWRWPREPPAIPSHANILRVYADATPQGTFPLTGLFSAGLFPVLAPGCVTCRDERGSDFVQTLVEVLLAELPHCDLLDLLTEVNRTDRKADVLGPYSDDICKMNLENLRLCLQVRDPAGRREIRSMSSTSNVPIPEILHSFLEWYCGIPWELHQSMAFIERLLCVEHSTVQ
uniref:Caspase family p10 domain-containing protein n=1 Tax=Ornithorhynchus anatinus TaxID=9258 RepID=F6QXM7_ORNAN